MYTKARSLSGKSSPQQNLKKQEPDKSDHVIGSVSAMNETPDEYVFYVIVPGMQRKDFSIAIKGKELIVSAEKRDLHVLPGHVEPFLHWEEKFKLPADADTVMTAAVFRNGELAIHIPKGKSTAKRSLVDIFVY